MILRTLTFGLVLFQALGTITALAAGSPTPKASPSPTPLAAKAKPSPSASVLNDSWYTMQAGSTPWGYYRETIEQKKNRFFYRYSMVKVEKSMLLEETIGAVSELDLTPVAFNLVKSGAGATEIIDATYTKTPSGGAFNVEIQGARSSRLQRNVAKNTILDVFFPLYLKNEWSKFKPGYRGWLYTFAEDAGRDEFRNREVRFEIKETNSELGCTMINVDIDSSRGKWCMTPDGVLIDLKLGGFHVRRVSGEKEAKDFLSGILPAKATGNE